MQNLAGVFFQVHPLDADPLRPSAGVDHQVPVVANRVGFLVLADLKPLGKVGIEIVLAVEHRIHRHLAVQGQRGAKHHLNRGSAPAAPLASPGIPDTRGCSVPRQRPPGTGKTFCFGCEARHGLPCPRSGGIQTSSRVYLRHARELKSHVRMGLPHVRMGLLPARQFLLNKGKEPSSMPSRASLLKQ